ncbi:hypothetical protein [Saccharospirillum impatiens]|uniref:hypothetical protein n=1 Tax=Saccharospirillum impatiens TaxID=169438 RepID=UPI00048A737E|nr:hypothetical protein [Saccharospirillum impatiens]
MEIIIGIVVVVVIIMFFGGIDNNRPVTSWSNDKLERMHGKLLYAASAQAKAGNFQKSEEHSRKAQEVEQEIERRKQARIKELGEKTFDPNNTSDFAELTKIMAEKSLQLLNKTMSENSCTEDEAKEIVSQRIETLASEYVMEGMNDEDAKQKAISKILGINS